MIRFKFYLFFIFLFSLSNFCLSQTIIEGIIANEKTNEPIPFGNIYIKANSSSVITSYTCSSESGNYQIETLKTGKLFLVFSALGYETQKSQIEITTETKTIIKNIVLKEKSFSLNEVIINAEKPIIIKKDTISFKASAFTKGNEIVVEDLLKNLPGLNISSSGTIKIGNQEIEKVMIDGDDFFEKGYKILTKNMPPSPIDRIEVLKNYSNNKHLKGIENSQKVALNLILNEEAKRVWFGNCSISYGLISRSHYSTQGNLMNFGKTKKYYFTTNFNNIGYDATGSINHLIRPFRIDEPSSIGDDQNVNNSINIKPFISDFKESRTNFNNAKLISLNAIYNLSKISKLKTLGFLNWDKNNFYRNSIQNYRLSNDNFINKESYVLKNKNITGFAKVDLIIDISKNQTIESTTKYNNQDENSNSNLIFNDKKTTESLNSKNELIDHKTIFSKKFHNNKILLFTGRYISEKRPQNYDFKPIVFQDLIPDQENINKTSQTIENSMQFFGVEAHYFEKTRNGNLLEIQIGNQFRNDKLATNLYFDENNSFTLAPSEYHNDLKYCSNNLYLNTKYRLEIKNYAFTSKLNLHQLFNKAEQNYTANQNTFFINPKFGFDWNINKKNKIFISYSRNTTNSKVLDIYNGYILTGFNSFSRGVGDLKQLNSSTAILNYRLGNWNDIFFVTTSVLYNKNHNFYSTNSLVTQNYSQYERILIKDREMLSITSNIDKYIKLVSSNIKLSFSYSKSNYKNIINDSDLREVKSTNYNYGIELRSGFKGFFNYHIGTKWTTNRIKTLIVNSYTNNTSFLDLSFVFNERFNMQFQSERYHFGNINDNNNTYYFADFTARYTIKKNKLLLSINGKNLFDTKTFKRQSIDDISSSSTTYRILPMHILFKIEYRF